MRPASIVRFEQAYLASIALWLASLAAGGWGMMVRQSREEFEDRPAFAGNPQMLEIVEPVLIGFVAIGVLVWLFLCFFIARRGSDNARWLIVGVTAVSALRLPSVVLSYPFTGFLVTTLTILATLLAIYAVWQIFRADTAIWFAQHDDEQQTAMPE